MVDFPEEIHVGQDYDTRVLEIEDGGNLVEIYDYSQRYIRADLVPQWQPIETAPHDADVILASPPSPTNREWLFEVGAASTGRRFDNGYSSMSFHGHATHWMPISKVPE